MEYLEKKKRTIKMEEDKKKRTWRKKCTKVIFIKKRNLEKENTNKKEKKLSK